MLPVKNGRLISQFNLYTYWNYFALILNFQVGQLLWKWRFHFKKKRQITHLRLRKSILNDLWNGTFCYSNHKLILLFQISRLSVWCFNLKNKLSFTQFWFQHPFFILNLFVVSKFWSIEKEYFFNVPEKIVNKNGFRMVLSFRTSRMKLWKFGKYQLLYYHEFIYWNHNILRTVCKL